MDYYGGGPLTGGPVPPNFPGNQQIHNPEMDRYGNPMPTQYGGQYGQYGSHSSGPMPPYDQYGGHSGPGMSMPSGPGHGPMEPFNTNGMQPYGYQGQPQGHVRDEPTKILRRPLGPMQGNQKSITDTYDPSFPTSTGGPDMRPNDGGINHSHFHPGGYQPNQMPMSAVYNHPPESVHPVPGPSSDSRFGNYSNLPSGSGTGFGAATANIPATSTAVSSSRSEESKIRVMTGLVTQIQPGGFGMISEEIFFQQSAVTGDMPKVGDKVVVEAEAVNGMPFKYNAKKVTKLDMDLVRDDSSSNMPANSFNANSFGTISLPLPSLPESLNLRRPSPPPLKSILKRNPPPPPVISKTGQKSLREELKSTSKSSYKAPESEKNFQQQNPLEIHRQRSLELEIPQLKLPPPAPVDEFAEFTYVTDNILNLNTKQPSPPHKSRDRSAKSSPPLVIDYLEILNRARRRSPSPLFREILGDRGRHSSPEAKQRKRSFSRSPTPKRHLKKHHSPSRKNRSRSSTPKRSRKLSPSPKHRNRSRSSSSHRPRSHRRKSSRSRSRDRKKSRSSSGSRRNRNRSRSSSTQRYRRKSRSTSRGRKQSRSNSLSGRYKTSPLPSPSRLYRRRSRSGSVTRIRIVPPNTNDGRNRSRSRSVTPVRHRVIQRSRSRDRGTSRSRRHRSRSGSRKRRSPSSSDSIQSIPQTSGADSQVHGIMYTKASSTLLPPLVDHGYRDDPKRRTICNERSAQRTKDSAASNTNNKKKGPPLPIKFQIANPAAATSTPTPNSLLLPNPAFIPTSQLRNSAFNITKTVHNSAAATTSNVKEKKKKPKGQEPAFRIVPKQAQADQTPKPEEKEPRFLIIEEKIKQWEEERKKKDLNLNTSQPPKPTPKLSKPSTFETVTVSKSSPDLDILKLKQTVLNDLHQLRAKEGEKASLANKINIEELKQTVQRDLSTLKEKPMDKGVVPIRTIDNSKPPQDVKQSISIDLTELKNAVQEGLNELRSKFNSSSKVNDEKSKVEKEKVDTSQRNTNTGKQNQKNSNANNDKPGPSKNKNIDEKRPRSFSPAPGPNRGKTNKNPRFSSKDRSRDDATTTSDPWTQPVNEQMERLKEEIHAQRFKEEEIRLREMGDQAGLQQLYYMEDRRRRRLDEHHLARLRHREIHLKKSKNYIELNRLRQEWGPPHERLEKEKILRERRLAEEHEEAHLIGQAEAIRRHEVEYQLWLEQEADCRLRDSERASRGCEGLVLRRRTPSPSSSAERSGRMGAQDSRSRSSSYERYRDDWERRPIRSKSPIMDYETFVMRYRKGPPPHMTEEEYGPPPAFDPDFPPQQFRPPELEHDAFIIARAMNDVSRRQEELMQREMEIKCRMGEMADRRLPGQNYNDPRARNRRDPREYTRFPVPRR